MLVKGNKSIRKNIKNILLIQLGDIGDAVLSFPCIRALKENFPKANVIVAVREKAKGLIEDFPYASGVISVNKEKRRLGEEIIYQTKFFSYVRQFNFDMAIDLRTGTRGAALAYPVLDRESDSMLLTVNYGETECLLTWLISKVSRDNTWLSIISIYW